jgi:hypothetical protein
MRSDVDLHPWRLTVGNDQDTENPLVYTNFEFRDFSEQRSSWEPGASILDCTHEYGGGWCCNNQPDMHDHYVRQDMESIDDLHEYLPNESIVAYLHYMGGGSAGIRWYITGGSCLIPGFGFTPDKDSYPAAVLVWEDGELGFWKWLDEQDDPVKMSINIASERLDAYVKSVIEEYSMWASGDTYWIMLERLKGDDYEEVDSCGGFIGWDQVKDHLSCWLSEEEIAQEDWELIEKYY